MFCKARKLNSQQVRNYRSKLQNSTDRWDENQAGIVIADETKLLYSMEKEQQIMGEDKISKGYYKGLVKNLQKLSPSINCKLEQCH